MPYSILEFQKQNSLSLTPIFHQLKSEVFLFYLTKINQKVCVETSLFITLMKEMRSKFLSDIVLKALFAN